MTDFYHNFITREVGTKGCLMSEALAVLEVPVWKHIVLEALVLEALIVLEAQVVLEAKHQLVLEALVLEALVLEAPSSGSAGA